jgi:cation:H+ antiporter
MQRAFIILFWRNIVLASQSLWVVSLIGIAALALLVLSANEAVKKLVGIASYFNLSSTFMGMTVISVATSIPEITSHLTASVNILAGTLDYKTGSAIVLGANIGSDVVQQTLIMGIVVLLAGTMYFRRYMLWKSMLPMVAASLLCLLMGLNGGFSRLDGIVLIVAFLGYNYYLYVDERKHFKKEDNVHESEKIAENVPQSSKEVVIDSLVSLLLIGLTIVAATVVLELTELLVNRTGVGGSLIGVVTLGVASALPELTTAIAGIGNKEHGISLGALVGSNITNPLLAIGSGAVVSTYWAPRPLLAWDLPWAIATGSILWAILWFSGGKLKKGHAIYLILIYFVYILSRAVFFSVD